jgi:hypothetical protein
MLPIDKQLKALSVRSGIFSCREILTRDFVVDNDALGIKEVLEELAQAPQLLDRRSASNCRERRWTGIVAAIVVYRSYSRG